MSGLFKQGWRVLTGRKDYFVNALGLLCLQLKLFIVSNGRKAVTDEQAIGLAAILLKVSFRDNLVMKLAMEFGRV